MARQVRLRNRQAAAVMQHEKLTGHAVQGGRHANQLVNERGAERHRGCTGSQPQDGTGARPSSVVSVESPPRAAASDVAATGTDRPSRRAGGVRRAGGGRAALGHPRVPAVPAARPTAGLRPSLHDCVRPAGNEDLHRVPAAVGAAKVCVASRGWQHAGVSARNRAEPSRAGPGRAGLRAGLCGNDQ